MLVRPQTQTPLSELRRRIEQATVVTPTLLAEVIALRPRVRRTSAAAGRIHQFVEAKAWSDAMFALIDIGLPRWSLVRLAFDDGEWSCTLSRHPQLPSWIDDSVDAHHAVMPLAILAAVIDACEADACLDRETVGSVPVCPARHEFSEIVCCDDFA